MSTQTSGEIFTFDHGQKKLNLAIGVSPEYLDDLGTQVSNLLKDFIFDDDKNLREDTSQSQLVEICANEFSYSQLVVLTSMYLQDRVDGFAKKLDDKLKNMKSSVKAIKLDADDVPDNIKEMLDKLTEGRSEGDPIDGDSLPPELTDFFKKLAEEQQRQEGDGDDD
jgi:hypothetical protein